MIAVANSLPLDLIQAVGAAPKVGRPRWEQLSQLLQATSGSWKEQVDMQRFMRLDSDARFALLLKSLTPKRTVRSLYLSAEIQRRRVLCQDRAERRQDESDR